MFENRIIEAIRYTCFYHALHTVYKLRFFHKRNIRTIIKCVETHIQSHDSIDLLFILCQLLEITFKGE